MIKYPFKRSLTNGQIICSNLAICKKENQPNCFKNIPNQVQNFAKFLKTPQKPFKILPKWRIFLPNLVMKFAQMLQKIYHRRFKILPNANPEKLQNFVDVQFQIFWNSGCQLVSLNFQTPDLPMQLNQVIDIVLSPIGECRFRGQDELPLSIKFKSTLFEVFIFMSIFGQHLSIAALCLEC